MVLAYPACLRLGNTLGWYCNAINSPTLSCLARYSLPRHCSPHPAVVDENAIRWGMILEFLCTGLEFILLALAREPFPFFDLFFFFNVRTRTLRTYEHVAVEHLPRAHHSTGQPHMPCTAQRGKARTCRLYVARPHKIKQNHPARTRAMPSINPFRTAVSFLGTNRSISK